MLDVGCGDGKFTTAYLDSVADLNAVDASASHNASATQDYASSKARYVEADCSFLEKDAEAVSGTWDKVLAGPLDDTAHQPC